MHQDEKKHSEIRKPTKGVANTKTVTLNEKQGLGHFKSLLSILLPVRTSWVLSYHRHSWKRTISQVSHSVGDTFSKMPSSASATSPASGAFPGKRSNGCGMAACKNTKKWVQNKGCSTGIREMLHTQVFMKLQQNLFFLQTQNLLSEHPDLGYSDHGRNTRLL